METVKPIPAIVPAAATDAQPTGGRRRPRLTFVASQVAPTIPTGLPRHSRAMIPSVTGDVYAVARNPALRWTPAFASAKSGTIA